MPVVYGLGRPRHDGQKLIFWLMNGSLILDVLSYVALFLTGNADWAVALELAYALMALWAMLLVVELRVFTRTTQPDRSWKFIRGAYAWLVMAMIMLPFLLSYGLWSSQGFSHAFWGAHLHAFTIGFINMMIIGVSPRVVLILAGIDSNQLTSLWKPFFLLNAGAQGVFFFKF